jgi:predicted CXXCH cytochrome family protein
MNVMHNGGKGTAAGAGYPAGSNFAFALGTDANTPVVMQNMVMFDGTTQGVMIGGSLGADKVDLRDDHPVGFSYQAVYDERTSKGTTTGLFSPSNAVSKSGSKIRLFGLNQKVECSSCHDPHVDYTTTPALKPFLVMDNTGSALCLSCHDK